MFVRIVPFHVLEILSVSGPEIFLVSNVFGTTGLVAQSSAPSRSSVVVGSAKMVRYCRLADMRAALSPNTGEKAVAHQGGVGWPFGMLRDYSLLGVDAVDQRRPTDQDQEERGKIPFL